MEHQCGKCGAWCIPVCPDCEDELHTSLRARVTELEAENTALRAHRCEVGMEDPDATLAHLKSLSPEELGSLNQLTNRHKR